MSYDEAPVVEEKVITVTDLYDSSRRQEILLEKLLNATLTLNVSLEKLNLRVQAVETAVKEIGTLSVPEQSSTPKHSKNKQPLEPRGIIIPPPGQGKIVQPIQTRLPDEPSQLSFEEQASRQMDEEARKAKEEAELEKRRKEEIERLNRLEEERKRKEAEAERIRIEELRKAEEERARKEALEQKTRSLMSGLMTQTGPGLFDDPKADGKQSKSLFDD